MSVVINELIDTEGVSGPDKICTLMPYKIIEVIGDEPSKEPDKEEPVSELPKPPTKITKDSIIDWVGNVLNYIKENNL